MSVNCCGQASTCRIPVRREESAPFEFSVSRKIEDAEEYEVDTLLNTAREHGWVSARAAKAHKLDGRSRRFIELPYGRSVWLPSERAKVCISRQVLVRMKNSQKSLKKAKTVARQGEKSPGREKRTYHLAQVDRSSRLSHHSRLHLAASASM